MAAATAAACGLTLLLALVPARLEANDAAAPAAWPSASGRYRLSYHSELQPIVINCIHSWVLHLETASGTPVSDARITVTGGMPEHNHGLPTQPQVTKNLGSGDYRLEGMRFHMNGHWELTVEIQVGDHRDTFTIPLEL